MNKEKNVTEEIKTEVASEVVIQPINHEELLVADEEKILLLQKPFTELTVDDLKKHQSFPAKVFQDERTIGFGRTARIEKFWMFAMLIAPTVKLTRIITDEELAAIQALNPKLISNKAVVNIPTKCLSGIGENGRRFYRIMACLCSSVYYGTSRKNKNNNGFLTNLQLTNLVVNNRNVKFEPRLKTVEFVDVNSDLIAKIDKDYTEEIVSSNEDF